MRKEHFSIEIHAPQEKVWRTLWQDKTFRDWTNNIDEGMYLLGELKEGNEVHFMSPNGFGVKSLVEKYVENESISFRHLMDTKDNAEREKEWTGGEESYSLTETNGITTLTVEMDLPPEQVENFKNIIPKALARVKWLSEEKE